MSRRTAIRDDHAAGLRAVVFDFVWPAFTWIDRITCEKYNNMVHFVVEHGKPQPRNKLAACRTMLKEIILLLFRGAPPGYSIVFRRIRARPRQAQVIMSDKLFRQIARKRAPWRLAAGR